MKPIKAIAEWENHNAIAFLGSFGLFFNRLECSYPYFSCNISKVKNSSMKHNLNLKCFAVIKTKGTSFMSNLKASRHIKQEPKFKTVRKNEKVI